MRGIVLIVDDDVGIRSILREIVEEEGYRATECYDGADGVEAFRQIHPDVVLMDLCMPRVSGIEATALIHQEDPDACIFVITAFDDPGLRSVAQAAGAREYILKEDLGVLRRHLHREWRPEAA